MLVTVGGTWERKKESLEGYRKGRKHLLLVILF